MAVEIVMPRVDMDMTAGVILRWHVKEGEAVSAGSPLFDMETDKATMEIESPAGGILRSVRITAGDAAPVGWPIAFILGDSEDETTIPAPKPMPEFVYPNLGKACAIPERVLKQSPVIAPLSGEQLATPYARKLARDGKLDLTRINGSGPFGRIQAGDVIQALNGSVPHSVTPNERRIPLDAMRRRIAERLTKAKQDIPHYYLKTSCRVDRLLALRQTLNAERSADDAKISVTDFIVKALGVALHLVPNANVGWGENCLIQHSSSDIAVAVAVEGGLFAPVVAGVEQLKLADLSARIKELTEKARGRKLSPLDYLGGSSSVSNLGMYGVEEFSAIITPPQSSILAVGSVEQLYVQENGQPVWASKITCTLSLDHRAIDGATGAQLLQAFRDLMESPEQLLL